MQAFMGSIIAIVFIVLAANIFMVLRRYRSTKSRRSRTAVLEEDKAAIIRDRLINSRLEQDRENAEELIERRRKTFALYDQVRKNALTAGQDPAAANAKTSTIEWGVEYHKECAAQTTDRKAENPKIDDSLFIPFDN